MGCCIKATHSVSASMLTILDTFLYLNPFDTKWHFTNEATEAQERSMIFFTIIKQYNRIKNQVCCL